MKTLYIGECFSDDPAGRFYKDGDGSGEEFREEILKPLFSKLKKIKINIDKDVEGYGSSFLVEAFAGLIKYGYFEKSDVLSKLEIECDNENYALYKNKIFQYINEAIYNSEEYKSTKVEALKEGAFEGYIDKSFLNDFIQEN